MKLKTLALAFAGVIALLSTAHAQTSPGNVANGQIAGNQGAGYAAVPWLPSGTTCPSSWALLGQQFLNTTSGPTGDLLQIFDGANCVTLGTLNATAHTWTPSVVFGDGSAAAPSVHGSDTTSGMYFDKTITGFTSTGFPSWSIGGAAALSWLPNPNFGDTVPELYLSTPDTSNAGVGFWQSVPSGQSGSATIRLHRWGTSNEASVNLASARGVSGTPTAIQLGDTLGLYCMSGYGGATHGFQSGNGASQVCSQAFADENFSDTTKGSVFGVLAVPRGSITRNTVFKIDGNANVVIEPPNGSNNTGLALPGQGVLFIGAATAPTAAKSGYTSIWNDNAGDLAVEGMGSQLVVARPGTGGAGRGGFGGVSYGTGNVSRFSGFQARGTNGSATATQSGDVLAQVDGTGYDSTNALTVISGSTQFVAAENFTATAHGGYWQLNLVPPTTLTTKTALQANAVASAVNYLNLTNSATTNPVIVGAAGTDTNIGINITPKGSGAVSLAGISYPTSVNSNGVLYASSTSAITSTAAGTNGQLFLGVTSGAPQFASMSQDCTITNAGVMTCTKTNNVAFGPFATQATPCTASQGCTGDTSLTAHAVLLGEGTGAVAFATIGTGGRLLIDQGAGADPAFTAMSGDGAITSGGALTISKINGVAFSYTQGTWTPTLAGDGTAGTWTYTAQVGSYEQIGRSILVRFTITAATNPVAPTGNLTITGLPFTSANVTNDTGNCSFNFVNDWTGAAGYTWFAGQIGSNSSTILLVEDGSGKVGQQTPVAEYTLAGVNLHGACNYHT